MPDEDNNFGGSLVLDFRKRRRHMEPKNTWSLKKVYPFRAEPPGIGHHREYQAMEGS